MDTVSNPVLSKLPEKIHAIDLEGILNHYPDIKVLSLDCFDTLLWRKTATPVDVFYDLQQRPAFNALGFTALMRIRAEMDARMLKLIQHKTNEVQLRDIYRAPFSHLSEEELNALETDEVNAEINACYAFPYVVELIRKAYAQGLKIIIVSDTYLRQNQLHHLLANTLPNDVLTAIDMIFCSNEFGKSKANGLFNEVIEKLNLSPSDILHIGDNPLADLASAKAMKLHALQLLHHDNAQIDDLVRMHSISASCLDPSIRDSRSLTNPFHGILATRNFSTDKPEHLIGYAVLGPLMYAFAQFIQNDIEQLKREGKNPKVCFLMRDAHLPLLACEALQEKFLGHRIRISRFASYAATFRTQDDVDRYLIGVIGGNRLGDIARQLLLPEHISKPIIVAAAKSKNPVFEFCRLIRQENILHIIFKQSAAYRERLLYYIKKETQLERDDTLIFVDLGYSGTTQRLLENILQEEMNIDVLGRYLISLAVPNWKVNRRGLIDPSWCDSRAMLTLIPYIALLEKLCTSADESVIDYDQKGNPIYGEATLSQEQHHNLERLQIECVRFIKDANEFFSFSQTKPSMQALQDHALAGLGRLLFLPTQVEIDYLQSFQFDLNLATNDTFTMIDPEKGLAGLRRRGLFSLFMEKNVKSLRTNAPAELRAAGLELSLSLMTHHRFSLNVLLKDTSLRREKLNAIIIRGKETSQVTLEAFFTHDGYFTLWIPIGTGNFNIGILFGKKYQWLQIESAELIAARSFLSSLESQETEDAWSSLTFEKMVEKGCDKGGILYECLSDASFAMITPMPKNNNINSILRLVFRPVISRI